MTRRMKAILVDDERQGLNLLTRLVEKDGRLEVAGSFTSPHSALEAAPDIAPDVAFLDIDMPQMNGVELSYRLKNLLPSIEIVFVTAHMQYAIEAFEQNALHYLLKPTSLDKVSEVVKRLGKVHVPGVRHSSSVQIRAEGLGTFFVSSNGEPVRWRTNKTEELAAYLLMKGSSPIPKWDIIGDLWPDISEQQAHTYLHTTIYKLKKTLENCGAAIQIHFFSGNYHVEIPDVDCDWLHFEAFVHSDWLSLADVETPLKGWLSAYQGDLFGKLDYAWIIPYRERWSVYYQHLALQASRYWIGRNNEWSAEMTLRALLDRYPSNEEGSELLLSLYMRQNNRPAFLRFYGQMKQALWEDFGIEPRESIQAMHAQVAGIAIE